MGLPAIADPAAFIAGLDPKQKADLDRILAKELHEATLGNAEWRIDNLYWIQNEQGKKVRFVRNEAQRSWWHNRWWLNVILKARQLGFSTEIAIEMLDECLFIPNFTAGIIDYSIDDAKKKLDKIKFAYDNLPAYLKLQTRLIKDNTETLEFSNGSKVEVGTSHRGGTLQHLHVSEYGKISAVRPDKAKEIKIGGFGTVHVGMRIDVESTAAGIGGEFHDMVQRAEALAQEGRELSQLDFKLHFFAWWQHPGYVLDPRNVRISAELADYFTDLKANHRIDLSPEQRAWYAAKLAQIGIDGIYQEYPSYPDEAFKASVDGAYFKRQMSKARLDGRITRLHHDEMRLVNTFWDIGNDTTSIWFHQTDGVRHRLIDYYEAADESIAHYAMELKDRSEAVGYNYGKHYGPHDLENTEWGGTGKTRKEIAEGLGLKFTVIPRIDDKNDAIDAARLFLGMCWFDEIHCARGIACLDNYKKKWNKLLSTWSREPLHDWASHGADSFMTGAMGYKPEREPKKTIPALPVLKAGIPAERGTGWMGRR